jgi:hypothetical protein
MQVHNGAEYPALWPAFCVSKLMGSNVVFSSCAELYRVGYHDPLSCEL